MADLLATQLPWLFAPGRRQAWRRRVARRVVAGLLLSLGLALAVGRGAPEPTAAALVAVADVAAGTPVDAGDVRVVDRPASTVPQDALQAPDGAVGRLATVALAEGEVLTPARVLGSDASTAGPGRRVVTVPLIGAARSLAVGDLVDVYRPGRREPVAEEARVVAIPVGGDEPAAIPEPTAVLSLSAASAGDIVDALDEDVATGFVLTARGLSPGR